MTAEDGWEPAPKFIGLAIGGPLAGSWITHGQPHYRCIQREPFDITNSPPALSNVMEVTVKTITYKHIIGFRHRVKGEWTDDVLNFWIPSDENWNPLECVRQMAEDYANYHDLRNS